MNSAERIEQIQNRLSLANDGPWHEKDWNSDPELKVVYMSPLMGFDGQSGQGVMMHRRNAPLCANAPDDLRFLIDVVSYLEQELKQASKATKLAQAIKAICDAK